MVYQFDKTSCSNEALSSSFELSPTSMLFCLVGVCGNGSASGNEILCMKYLAVVLSACGSLERL
jgi:hypothetical protein